MVPRVNIVYLSRKSKTSFDGLTEGYTDKVKHKKGHHLLVRTPRCRSGRKSQQPQGLQRVTLSTHHQRVTTNEN